MVDSKMDLLEQETLVRDMRELILQGFRSKDIHKFANDVYGISKPQAQRYLKKARDDFKQIDKKTKDQLRSKYRSRLEKMYHQALIVDKNPYFALKVQKELNKLVDIIDETPQMPDLRVIFKHESEND